MAGNTAVRGAMRTLVLAAFVVIAALFVGMGLLTFHRVRDAQRQTRSLVENTLESVELVHTMRHDIGRKRLLLDEHIFEKGEAPKLDAEMDALDAELQASAAAYNRLATLPGERAELDEVQHDVAATRAPIDRILVLSRTDRDVEAYEERERLNPAFADIDEDLAALIRLNHDGADRTLAEMASLQRASSWFIGLMAGVGLGLTGLVGGSVTRMVQSRETRLRWYSETLETRNRDLDAFAGRVAHDLRGPLTTVGFAASRLERSTSGEQGTIAILHRAVGRMERLIEDLLALSRLDATPRDGVGDPSKAVAEVQEDMATRIGGGDARVSVHVDPAPVHCAPGLLRQAIFNLVDNAVKYRRSEVPLEVDIDGHRIADRYELRVRDNGLGMCPEEARCAFDPFYRALEVQDRPGTGLGLSIVKRVVESAGGTVRVDSERGKGSQFVITLPVAPVAF